MTTHPAGEIPGFNGTRIAPAGVDWDAVRLPRFLGLQALNRLQAELNTLAPARAALRHPVCPWSARR